MEERNYVERKDERMARPKRRGQEDEVAIFPIVVGGLALVGLAAIIVAVLPDLKRYIKLTRM